MGIERREIVLKLNANWLPIEITSVKDALTAMNSVSPTTGRVAAFGMNIEYARKKDGSWDFEKPIVMKAVSWDEWLTLGIRDFDEVIHTSKQAIRVPSVIVAEGYKKMPIKFLKPTRQGVYERDGGVCQYSGKPLSRKSATLDHVISKDEWKRTKKMGSPDNWQNLVLCDKDINTRKGNKSLKEAGLKLLREPKAPPGMTAASLIRNYRDFPCWRHFLV